MIDAVNLSPDDDDQSPPDKVLQLQLVGASENDPRDTVYLIAYENEETNESTTLSVLANFGLDLDDLLSAINLLSLSGPIVQRVAKGAA